MGVRFLSTLGTTALSYRFITSMRRIQVLQVKLNFLNNTQNFLHQLVAEAAEYSKKDPSINSVLQVLAPPNPNADALLPSQIPAK